MKEKIVNIIGLLGSITIFFVLVASMIKSFKRLSDGDELIAKNEVRLEKIKEENAKLTEQLKVIQSEEYSEKQYRDKLGLAKEGEIIVVLPEADVVRKLSPSIPEEQEIRPRPNWQKWFDLFF